MNTIILPQRNDSVTCQLWRKHMRPWQPGSGNRLVKMSDEEKARLLDHLRPFMDTMDAHFGRHGPVQEGG